DETIEISSVRRDALERLARDAKATLSMAILSVFEALVARWVGQTEFCLGIPVANRARPQFESLIGFFVNTLPLAVDLRGRPGFRELLTRVRKSVLDVLAHQDVPFDRLVQMLAAGRNPDQAPLFQAMFVYENFGWRGTEAAGLTIGEVRIDH